MALNLYDFVVRRPGEPAEKYGLRAYDEIILAPMVATSISPLKLKNGTDDHRSVSSNPGSLNLIENESACRVILIQTSQRKFWNIKGIISYVNSYFGMPQL